MDGFLPVKVVVHESQMYRSTVDGLLDLCACDYSVVIMRDMSRQ